MPVSRSCAARTALCPTSRCGVVKKSLRRRWSRPGKASPTPTSPQWTVTATACCGHASRPGEEPASRSTGRCTPCANAEPCGGCSAKSAPDRPTTTSTAPSGSSRTNPTDGTAGPNAHRTPNLRSALRCARISAKTCPSLKPGYLAVRAHSFVSGAWGGLYSTGWPNQHPFLTGARTLQFGDPRLHWLQADQLVRELTHCTFIDLDA